jgi:1-pyrroline-5-carboxylate dehydrogenase
MTVKKRIKITYSTLATPDPDLDRMYEDAVAAARANAGGTYPMYINGEELLSGETFTKISPVDTTLTIGHFAFGKQPEVDQAVAAARAAFPGWRDTPWQERVRLLRQVADNISDNVLQIGAVLSLEVGKNRLEALGDVEESADLIRYCCDAMETNAGFAQPLLNESDHHHNRSVLKPFGVWGVIAPFNFPAALAVGPSGAALIAGNTVVLKPPTDAPMTSYLIMKAFAAAGLPAGVYNMVYGSGKTGRALTSNEDVDGMTFTGSYDVGMSIIRNFGAGGRFARPVIAELGGKNPTIITDKADLDKAAMGVMRSAFGLTGQKCSACSRVFVDEKVKDAFVAKLAALTREKITVGDPTRKVNYMGPIINRESYEGYQEYAAELRAGGNVVLGAETVETELDGFYVAPTIVTDIPPDHRLWQHEMFAPIVMIESFTDKEAAMARANNVDLGLTAGFFSEDDEEIDWFLNNIEAGVLYVNRETGATTGAWPGYQSFGGWKGSTGTNKAAGSFYYLQQYLREQSQSIVE